MTEHNTKIKSTLGTKTWDINENGGRKLAHCVGDGVPRRSTNMAPVFGKQLYFMWKASLIPVLSLKDQNGEHRLYGRPVVNLVSDDKNYMCDHFA